jgi:hypothetical protein
MLTVEQDPPRVALDPTAPHHDGPGRVHFLRRRD